MNISIKTQGFDRSSTLDTVIRDEIRSALARFSSEIVYVDVFMKDTNGPKGGIDKQVLLRIQLRGRQQVAVNTTKEDLYAAVRISVKRAKRAVRRSLSKARHFEKLSRKHLAETQA